MSDAVKQGFKDNLHYDIDLDTNNPEHIMAAQTAGLLTIEDCDPGSCFQEYEAERPRLLLTFKHEDTEI